jgi:hypothetical protein
MRGVRFCKWSEKSGKVIVKVGLGNSSRRENKKVM